VCDEEKFLEIPRHGWELNQGGGEGRQWDIFILPLSYHDSGHGEARQWDTFILPLSYHDALSWLTSFRWLAINILHASLFLVASIHLHSTTENYKEFHGEGKIDTDDRIYVYV